MSQRSKRFDSVSCTFEQFDDRERCAVDPLPFRDTGLPVEDRVADLLGRLTDEEKVALLHQHQPAVPRLGLAAFHTGLEALHGVAWLGPATVFPQAIGLASSWDTDLVRRVGEAVGGAGHDARRVGSVDEAVEIMAKAAGASAEEFNKMLAETDLYTDRVRAGAFLEGDTIVADAIPGRAELAFRRDNDASDSSVRSA